MIDFNLALGAELAREHQRSHDRLAHDLRWRRELRDPAPRNPVRHGIRRFFRSTEAERRREFASALDAAQRAGITIDAWFGFKFADPALSARAEWAGLNDTVEIQDRRARHAA